MGIKDKIEQIDTNIIVRLITKDNFKMLERARRLFSQTNKLFAFEDAAMMEVVFVLEHNYNYSRLEIAESIKNLTRIYNLVFNHTIISGTLDLYVAHPKLSFVDCYQAVVAEISNQTPLWTFDHKLAAQCKVAKEL